MSGMFSSPQIKQPEAPPPSPILEEEKMRLRDAESARAYSDLVAGGRRSTMFAGRQTAMEEQKAKAKRRAGEELL